MTLERDILARAVAEHGPVARVVIAGTEGSAPRETGAAMLVWRGGQSGTIGGGTLEHRAAEEARAMIASGAQRQAARIALGPALGQCCGGAVRLLTEVFDARAVAALTAPVFARRVEGPAEMPLAMRRQLALGRSQGLALAPQWVEGWFAEPVAGAAEPLWIYGAGHVGRALVSVLSPLPDFAITWVDTGPGRFPAEIPDGVERLVAADPAEATRYAPARAHHLIVTYSHALDLELCHRLLARGFASAGLIGSATKWARFRRRLAQLGHGDAQISRIRCPIGQPALGKHPQAIAVGVAAQLLSRENANAGARGATG